MADVDYEVEYNNRARVPENPELMAGWARDAAAYREQCAPRRLTYGPGARNVIDVFAGGRKSQDTDKAPLAGFCVALSLRICHGSIHVYESSNVRARSWGLSRRGR